MWGTDGYYLEDDESVGSPYYISKSFCIHSWKPVLLLTTTVWDCEKCGKKKEEWEAECKKNN